MIRNDKEYTYTRERIADFTNQADAIAAELDADGHTEEDIALAVAATRGLIAELAWERDLYDRLHSEGLSAVPAYPPPERGKALIAIRIARRMSQKDLADTLGVSQAQVSRDENNDYRGITQDRYARILAALRVDEHIAGYAPRDPVTIHMPVIVREAACFVPDYQQQYTVTPPPKEG